MVLWCFFNWFYGGFMVMLCGLKGIFSFFLSRGCLPLLAAFILLASKAGILYT